MNSVPLIPSFPRKRECGDFSHLPWAPRFRGAFAGATIWWAGGISPHARKAGVPEAQWR